MKKRITDLLDNLPVELLEELEHYELKKYNQSRKKRLTIIIAIIITLLVGCTAYVVTEMPVKFAAYFNNSNEKLVDDLYLNYTDYVESNNYRLTVEGIVSDVNYKQLLITVTAISKEAKENFDKNICPEPAILKGLGSGSKSSHPSFENKYKMEFYYEIETSETECVVILCEDYVANNTYELAGEVLQATEKFINQSGYSWREIIEADDGAEIYNKAMKQAVKEKKGIMLEFPIASKDNKCISIKIGNNNNLLSYNVDKIEITRTTLLIQGYISGIDEQNIEDFTVTHMEIIPTIYIVLENGTKQLLAKGNMGFETVIEKAEDLISNRYKSSSEGDGEFSQKMLFINPIDLGEISKIIVNDIEYDVK